MLSAKSGSSRYELRKMDSARVHVAKIGFQYQERTNGLCIRTSVEYVRRLNEE